MRLMLLCLKSPSLQVRTVPAQSAAVQKLDVSHLGQAQDGAACATRVKVVACGGARSQKRRGKQPACSTGDIKASASSPWAL